MQYKYSHIHNFALILNTHISTIHQYTIFMVISYYQNLYFRIQCKNNYKHNYNSFSWYFLYHIRITQQIEYENQWRSLYSLIYWKLQQNYNKKSMFYLNVIKQQIKFVISNTIICRFFTKHLHLFFLTSKLCVYECPSLPKTPILG